MLIDRIPYVRMDTEVTSSMCACITMLLSFYNIKTTGEEVSDIFGSAFLSGRYNDWLSGAPGRSEMMACAQHIINDKFGNGVDADIINTDISKIRLSYIKREIPVIITGMFPLLSGKTSGSVLVKGYVGGYLVVNDPRGNAYSGYRDRLGENILYLESDLKRWIGDEDIILLRILDKT